MDLSADLTAVVRSAKAVVLVKADMRGQYREQTTTHGAIDRTNAMTAFLVMVTPHGTSRKEALSGEPPAR